MVRMTWVAHTMKTQSTQDRKGMTKRECLQEEAAFADRGLANYDKLEKVMIRGHLRETQGR